jgi:hypothetical protein
MKMTAPAGMTGHVHVSSGGVYAIDEHGTVDVHHHHLGDMLRLGFSTDGTVNEQPPAQAQSTFTQDFIAGVD